MGHLIGIDIGGTKIAGGIFTCDGELLHQVVMPTPKDYALFIPAVSTIVSELEAKVGQTCPVGLGMVGSIHREERRVSSGNLLCVNDQPLFDDLEKALGRDIRFANDADAMALAEALDGAGKGKRVVLGLVLGTGVGSGLIVDKRIIEGINGMAGDIGQIPMPYYEPSDGPIKKIKFGAPGAIESFINGFGLAALCKRLTGQDWQPPEIADKALAGETEALKVLDHYYELVAKSLSVPIHIIDPDVIIVSGGLNSLPCMYDEVPKRWGKYCVVDKVRTGFTPATHGPMAAMRGAAYLWRD